MVGLSTITSRTANCAFALLAFVTRRMPTTSAVASLIWRYRLIAPLRWVSNYVYKLASDIHCGKTLSKNEHLGGFSNGQQTETQFETLRSEEHTSELQSLRHLVCR